MVHDVLSTIYWCREAQTTDTRGHVKVIFSPLVIHVGVSISAGEKFRFHSNIINLKDVLE